MLDFIPQVRKSWSFLSVEIAVFEKFGCIFVSSSNYMGKSKFHVFAENLRICLSQRNTLKRCIQLYNCMIKLLYIFRVGKFSIEFEEDTYFLLIQVLKYFSFSRISNSLCFFKSSFNVGGTGHILASFLLSIIYEGFFSIFTLVIAANFL